MKLLYNSAKGEIEVGCHVIVLRTAEDRENGCNNSWVPYAMDNMVGRTSEVRRIIEGFRNEDCRQMTLEDNYQYPEFVLEEV
mgnify:CR=1 FL=1